ncbi:unnamed protein product [Discosporangium mesarthrocarpum]
MKWGFKPKLPKQPKKGSDGADAVGVDGVRYTQLGVGWSGEEGKSGPERDSFSSMPSKQDSISISQDPRTALVTPSDLHGEEGGDITNKSNGLHSGEQEDEHSAPPFTVDDGEVEDGAGQAPDVGGGGDGDDQENVFDDETAADHEESGGDADSLKASKTARMRSFAENPDAHELVGESGEWDEEVEGAENGDLEEEGDVYNGNDANDQPQFGSSYRDGSGANSQSNHSLRSPGGNGT